MNTIKLNYGDKIEYSKDNPRVTFQFPDFAILYLGYLKSRYELGLESSPVFSGVHVFQIFGLAGDDSISFDKNEVFLWGSGTGILFPCSLIVNNAKYLFYPYADSNKNLPSRVVAVTEDNKLDFVENTAVTI